MAIVAVVFPPIKVCLTIEAHFAFCDLDYNIPDSPLKCLFILLINFKLQLYKDY